MSLYLFGLSFLNPWILTALLALPALWWLLKLTPPSPQKIAFPAIRFLLELNNKEESAASLPWWLLALRLFIASLVILALAGPVLNKGAPSQSGTPVVLIIDNGWASAPDWPKRAKLLDRLTNQFLEEERLVYAISTLSRPTDSAPVLTAVKANELAGLSHKMRPLSRSSDRSALKKYFPAFATLDNPEFIWISDDLTSSEPLADVEAVFGELSAFGPVTIYSDASTTAPPIIHSPLVKTDGLSFTVRKASGDRNRLGVVLGKSKSGRVLFQQPFQFKDGEDSASVETTLPADIRNEIARLEIKNSQSAGSLFLLDDRWQRRQIGLVAEGEKSQTPSLLSESHYLEKALTPFYDIRKSPLADLIDANVSMIALGDTAALSARLSSALKSWVDKGGVLIRFAGPKLANAKSDLLPVELRSGNRNLDGAMSWSKPSALGDMPENSPFADLAIDPSIRISKQVLANPSADLSRKTWAQLEDGTPLVTAADQKDGQIILFHTTATTAWSNLVLSGLFVEMLREISYLGSFSQPGSRVLETLPPVDLVDGFGTSIGQTEQGALLPLDLPADPAKRINYPAGLYGSAAFHLANNIGSFADHYGHLDYTNLPGKQLTYDLDAVLSFVPPLLITIILLILTDMIASLGLQGRLPSLKSKRRRNPALGLLIALAFLFLADGRQVEAEESMERLLEATLQTRLGYIITGDDSTDQMSRDGLRGLSQQLRRRTAIEAAGPLPIHIEKNELLFFPLVYWPISASFPSISDEATAKINRYLQGGGTILFDTRNQFGSGLFGGNVQATPENQRLRAILERLDIQRLSPVPTDHVLTRAFYLTQSFPGRYRDGQVWVENTENGNGNDGVASVVIGSNDWASAWAIDQNGRPVAAMVPGGERQREMATRFGINLVMYTLAGNYKADQVHIPAILERLGQ